MIVQRVQRELAVLWRQWRTNRVLAGVEFFDPFSRSAKSPRRIGRPISSFHVIVQSAHDVGRAHPWPSFGGCGNYGFFLRLLSRGRYRPRTSTSSSQISLTVRPEAVDDEGYQ